jgi:hypothetical protein
MLDAYYLQKLASGPREIMLDAYYLQKLASGPREIIPTPTTFRSLLQVPVKSYQHLLPSEACFRCP